MMLMSILYACKNFVRLILFNKTLRVRFYSWDCQLTWFVDFLGYGLSQSLICSIKQSGLSAHFIRRLPRWASYPKPGLPMLRIVFLGIDPYPKPFKIKLRLLLAFLTLPNLRKRAIVVVSH
jgi:hypothetical protein